ncbi:MAG: hypothetical protein LBV22_00085 [Mycoplasmataceae bacterium]|nr:hypothetical protein [Mycoplasmataceae bacterium]
MFTSADQAKNYDYCNKLLAQENLIIHEKIMKFVSVDSVEKFVGHLDNLLTTNTVYFALNISMVVLYGLKAIFDAFTLACSWAFPPTAIQAAIQLAGDILSIIFISLEIYNSNKTIKKLEPMLAIFEKYLEKSKDPTQGYTQIRVAYEAYMNKLWIYKDTTREALERAEAAASVAETGGLYDVFMQLLTSNLFDFVNQSIELALGMDSKFDGDGFSWGVFKGMSGLGPFLASLIYNIIALLIVFVFVRVAGVVIKAASFAVVTVTDRLAANTLTKFENIALDIGNKVINETANLAEVTEVLINVRPLMKISGIAGAILAVMDILFTVGYSIMVSAIANSVNDMVSGFDKNSK